jgi:hypothetical protein
MRIGTWNLARRWGSEHLDFLLALDCDVLLLTEVNERVVVPDHHLHLSATTMMPKRRWAGILSRAPLEALRDPHPASAMAVVDGWTFCSSILPWRSCGDRPPWVTGRHVDKTAATVGTLLAALPRSGLVWGGDWNHALEGREWAGSIGGRGHVLNALEALNLTAPSSKLPHAIDGLLSIDHIAVPVDVPVSDVRRVVAAVDGRRLSDHDAYVVSIDASS